VDIRSNAAPAIFDALRSKRNVIGALMLRDMRTRFFGHGLGYLVSISWPLAHVLILTILWTVLGRATPYGESSTSYFASTLAPVMTTIYLSRFSCMSALQNKPLLWFPVVQPLDILIARILLESLSSICMILVLCLFLWTIEAQYWPEQPINYLLSICLAIYLGISLALINGAVAFMFPQWYMIYTLFSIILYFLSGIIFHVENLPEELVYYLSWNPLLHVAEIARSSFFSTYTSSMVDLNFVLLFGLVMIFSALILERYLRGVVRR